MEFVSVSCVVNGHTLDGRAEGEHIEEEDKSNNQIEK